jgi:hypothetical protein
VKTKLQVVVDSGNSDGDPTWIWVYHENGALLASGMALEGEADATAAARIFAQAMETETPKPE